MTGDGAFLIPLSARLFDHCDLFSYAVAFIRLLPVCSPEQRMTILEAEHVRFDSSRSYKKVKKVKLSA